MSNHKIPLTDLERTGLIAHGLGRDIGRPSQAADIFRQGVAWALANAPQLEQEPVAWPAGLIERIKAAEQRIQDGHAPRRIPAEPTDVDLVLAEVRYLLEGKQPPFWVHTPPPQRKPLTDKQFLELLLKTGTTELVSWATFVGGSIQMQGKIGLLRGAKLLKEFVEAAHGIKETK